MRAVLAGVAEAVFCSIRAALELPEMAVRWLFQVPWLCVATRAVSVCAGERFPPSLGSLLPRAVGLGWAGRGDRP